VALPVVHVTFSNTAGGSMRRALERLGRADLVIPLDDDLSIGPIDGNMRRRIRWLADAWRSREDRFEYMLDLGARWFQATREDCTAIVWMSSRGADELCGLHELCTRRSGPTWLVNVADVRLRYPNRMRDGVARFGYVPDAVITDNALLDRARLIGPRERAWYVSQWREQRRQRGILRIATERGLRTVPQAYFDANILALASTEWTLAVNLIGDALFSIDQRYHNTSELLVWMRIHNLIKAGQLEGRGSFETASAGWVRLPRRRRRSR
jgi:hypothetical protein